MLQMVLPWRQSRELGLSVRRKNSFRDKTVNQILQIVNQILQIIYIIFSKSLLITHPQKNNLFFCLAFWRCVLFWCLTWPTQQLPSGIAVSLNTTTMGKSMAWAESWNIKLGHDCIVSTQQTGRSLLAPLRAGGLFYWLAQISDPLEQ